MKNIRKIIGLLLVVCMCLNSCSKKEEEAPTEAPTITLTSENTKHYLQMDVKYINVEVEEAKEYVDEYVDGLFSFHYVCTATYTIKSRGPYIFKDAVVTLKIKNPPLLSDGNPWRTDKGTNSISLTDKYLGVSRIEYIYLDSSGNGSVDVVWRYMQGNLSTTPNVKKPENQTWDISFYASGELKEVKWSD